MLACRFPGSVVLTVLRGQLVLLQGIWFIQIAQILFRGEPLCCPSFMHVPLQTCC